MDPMRGNKVDFWLRIEDGGQAHVRRTHAERELERSVREVVYAMEGKSKGLRNVACGVTHPVRMLVRRFQEAKRARRPAVNYPLCKQLVRQLDAYVDDLFHMREAGVTAQRRDLEELLFPTGDFPKVA